MKYLSLLCFFTLAACSSGPGPVTPETPVERQMLGFLEKFDRWDDNGNSELDAGELDRGIKSLQGKSQQVNYTAPQVIEFFDTDRSGTVSLKEAQAGYHRADQVANPTT